VRGGGYTPVFNPFMGARGKYHRTGYDRYGRGRGRGELFHNFSSVAAFYPGFYPSYISPDLKILPPFRPNDNNQCQTLEQ